jgi:hypothetical protein
MATGSGNQIFEEDTLLNVNDSRVRVIGLTSPKKGFVLVRLQSFAEEKLTIKLKIHKKLTNPILSTLLGEEISPLSVNNGVVEVAMDKIGVAGVLFKLS